MSRRAACSPAPIAVYARLQFGQRSEAVAPMTLHFEHVFEYVCGSGAIVPCMGRYSGTAFSRHRRSRCSEDR